jgi:histidine triad (HIT) family protein
MKCVFCEIVDKKIPADIVFENERIMVFKDIKPSAPVHLLIIPKKHFPSLNDIAFKDKDLVGELFLVAQEVAEKSDVKEKGYKIAINVGENAGQEIAHLHLHLLGGWKNN